jgi:hypothetical protein
MRLWVGVDAEWRAVIFPKGKEAKDRDRDRDKDKDKKEKHSNMQHGAATLQVCTVHLYHSLSFYFLSLFFHSPFPYPL